MSKDVSPGYWTISVSGHVTHPQSYLDAALKEIKEEVGLTLGKSDLTERGVLKIVYARECEISKLYEVRLTNTPKINFDPIEIDAVAWVDKTRLKDWIQTHPLTIAAREVLSYSKLI
jgi:isopentenyldiphosphate isomerase